MALSNPYDSEQPAEVVDSIVRADEGKALESIVHAETDIQVSTAKRYPRSIDRSLKLAEAMATLDEETAESCMYALPRGGKTIEGPSIRLAEIMATTWGNLRVVGRVTAQSDTFLTAYGMAWDLESNLAEAVEVRRRITDKHGAKFNEDMISVTAQAACAIARRNAIFAVVPRAYVNRIYKLCREIAVGKAETFVAKRDKLLASFQKIGVAPPMILAKLGLNGLDDITKDHLATLIGLANAIKNGEATIEEAFFVAEPEPDQRMEEARKTAEATKDRMRAKAAPAAEPEPDPEKVADELPLSEQGGVLA